MSLRLHVFSSLLVSMASFLPGSFATSAPALKEASGLLIDPATMTRFLAEGVTHHQSIDRIAPGSVTPAALEALPDLRINHQWNGFERIENRLGVANYIHFTGATPKDDRSLRIKTNYSLLNQSNWAGTGTAADTMLVSGSHAYYLGAVGASWSHAEITFGQLTATSDDPPGTRNDAFTTAANNQTFYGVRATGFILSNIQAGRSFTTDFYDPGGYLLRTFTGTAQANGEEIFFGFDAGEQRIGRVVITGNNGSANAGLDNLAFTPISTIDTTTPPIVTHPAKIVWGAYRHMEQLVGPGADQWAFTREHLDGLLLHGAYWGQTAGVSPPPETIGPELATLLAPHKTSILYEAMLAGLYPNIDSPFGTTFADTAINQINRLISWGFPQPDISTDFIINSWNEAVRYNPQWTSREFFTALTGNWNTYPGDRFDPAPDSQDRQRYGWFRQWVERLADTYPSIRVSATNSPVYFNWEEGGINRRELGPAFNSYHTWLKLERRGHNIRAFFSGDGHGWTDLGSANVDLGSAARAGLFVASNNESRLARGQANTVRVWPFFAHDIGVPGRGGSLSVSGSTFTLASHGNEFLRNGSSDAHFYTYREWSGDGEFIVRVDTLAGSNPDRTWPLAGIALRGSNHPDARTVSLHVNRDNQTRLQARLNPGSALSTITTTPAGGAPRWLRLTREGNTVSAAQSADGVSWTSVGIVNVALPTAIKVGLVVDSQVRFESATASFSEVNFLNPPNNSFSGTNLGGAGTGAGSSISGGMFTLEAAGVGISDDKDHARFHHTGFSGDGTLLARLHYFADLPNPSNALDAAAQLGIMLRAGTNADQRAVAIAFTPGLGLRTIARAQPSGPATALESHGANEVRIENPNARPLLHYFTGNDYMSNLHDAFPANDPYAANFSGFTTDSPYAGYQRWGGSETFPAARHHREKILLYERWLQERGHEHQFIANSADGGAFDGFDTSTQTGRDAWDLQYKAHSLRSIQLHQLEGGRPDKVIFESWYEGPFSLVPETKNGSFSNLAMDAIHYIKGVGQTLDLAIRGPGSTTFAGSGVQQSTPSGEQRIAHTPASMNEADVFTVRIRNMGTTFALPLLHAHETGGAGWSATYTIGGEDVTGSITGPGGLTITDAPLYSGNELIAPGEFVDIDLTIVATGATETRRILLRGFWNPQEPTTAPRDSIEIVLGPPLELIYNGGFENGIAGWQSNGGGGLAHETAVVRAGSGAVRGFNRAQAWQGPMQEITGRLVPGETYRLTAWLRVAGASSAPVRGTLARTDGGGTAFAAVFTGTAADSNWTKFTGTYTYTEPNGPVSQLRVYFEGPPAGVDLLADDVSLGYLGYSAWRIEYFGTLDRSGIAADDADPDGDGVENLLEYALGGDPLAANRAVLPILTVNEASKRLQITFDRVADPRLLYEVRATEALDESPQAIWSSSGDANIAGRVTVSDSEEISAIEQRFLRLRVSRE